MLVKGRTLFFAMLLLIKLSFFAYAKGGVAFDYSNPDKNDIEFLSNFSVVVTGKIWKKSMVESLKKRGVKLVFYDWLPADYFCKGSVDEWHRAVLKHLNSWVIDSSPEDPDPMGKRYGCKDYFFSFTDSFIEARVKHILATLKKTGYSGVFFDWASGFKAFQDDKSFVFLVREYRRKFGEKSYDLQVLKFLKALKNKGVFIVLNRGFRSKNAMFDRYADFDVAESVFTTDESSVCSEVFIKDYGLGKVCETEIEKPEVAIHYGKRFIEQAERVNPEIGFVFLNYDLPFYVKTNGTVYFKGKDFNIYRPKVDRQALFFSEAVAYLVGGINFVCGRDVGLSFVEDRVYSIKLGKPLGEYKAISCGKGKAYVRFFTNGFSVVGSPECFLKIKAFGHNRVYDALNGKIIETRKGFFPIGLHSQTYFGGLLQPVGDIFLYK